MPRTGCKVNLWVLTLEAIKDVMKVFPPDAATKGIMPSGDQIGKWIKAGRIVFPENQRVVIWETLEDLLNAIDASDVPLAKKIQEDLAGNPTLGILGWQAFRLWHSAMGQIQIRAEKR